MRVCCIVFFALLLTSCGHQVPTLPGFNGETWRSDTYACKGLRQRQLTILENNRDVLYGVHTDAIDQLLGRPDEVELSAQTERVYTYYVRPGAQCSPGHPHASAGRLSLRFDPLGLVTEVLMPSARP